jgi:hypothetical protein
VYTSTTFSDNLVVSATICLFSADKDTMVPDIELNAKCWQSHTTSDFENIIYEGDCEKVSRNLTIEKGHARGGVFLSIT